MQGPSPPPLTLNASLFANIDFEGALLSSDGRGRHASVAKKRRMSCSSEDAPAIGWFLLWPTVAFGSYWLCLYSKETMDSWISVLTKRHKIHVEYKDFMCPNELDRIYW
jgi:hypothetical protein